MRVLPWGRGHLWWSPPLLACHWLSQIKSPLRCPPLALILFATTSRWALCALHESLFYCKSTTQFTPACMQSHIWPPPTSLFTVGTRTSACLVVYSIWQCVCSDKKNYNNLSAMLRCQIPVSLCTDTATTLSGEYAPGDDMISSWGQ